MGYLKTENKEEDLPTGPDRSFDRDFEEELLKEAKKEKEARKEALKDDSNTEKLKLIDAARELGDSDDIELMLVDMLDNAKHADGKLAAGEKLALFGILQEQRIKRIDQDLDGQLGEFLGFERSLQSQWDQLEKPNIADQLDEQLESCLLYTSPSPRD